MSHSEEERDLWLDKDGWWDKRQFATKYHMKFLLSKFQLRQQLECELAVMLRERDLAVTVDSCRCKRWFKERQQDDLLLCLLCLQPGLSSSVLTSRSRRWAFLHTVSWKNSSSQFCVLRFTLEWASSRTRHDPSEYFLHVKQPVVGLFPPPRPRLSPPGKIGIDAVYEAAKTAVKDTAKNLSQGYSSTIRISNKILNDPRW